MASFSEYLTALRSLTLRPDSTLLIIIIIIVIIIIILHHVVAARLHLASSGRPISFFHYLFT